MPKKAEKAIKSRGGATKWRMKKAKDGTMLRCAVTRKSGPKGGRTVCYKA